MIMQATGSFENKSWEEKPYHVVEGEPKLTRASVTNSFHGDIEGEGTLEYLLVYRDPASATFVGLERVIGRIGGRAGSFVLQHVGTFENGTVQGSWMVVPGSGTVELQGLRGAGSFIAHHGNPLAGLTLDYEID
jgi:hypothetical protein